ncbi:cardiolipin synthase [Microvirga yunnanensis]|uniref:cardiolipin synthase n=1 Tax=Microvirga yunnanensis TaxID=2953740 RepID=UPI0021C5A190|nr:cardiolipin synthase [Microvirga sp. HBU65207]
MLLSESAAWAGAYLALEWAIRVVMLVVVPFRRSPDAARSWLTLVFFLPIPALAIYLVIGRPTYPRWRRDRFAKLPKLLAVATRQITHSHFCRRPSLPGNLEDPALLIETLGKFPTLAGNDVEICSDYEQLIDDIVSDINRAKRSVHLLFYIFADDATGRRVMEALGQAARRGVACRVLIDAVGSRRWSRQVVKTLTSHGVHVRLALPVGLLRRRSARADLRNHRKIAVIDSRIGYVGSQNIVDADLDPDVVNEELMVRVTGPVALELQAVFAADWFMETDQVLDAPVLFPHRAPGDGVVAQVLASGPDYPDAGVGLLVVALIHGARERVVITTPYFVPDEALLQALKTAVLRGVNVSLVVPDETDHLIVKMAQRSYYSELLHFGVRVHSYKGCFLHAKHITIDGEIALIGSSNVDIRSFVLNAEVSLIVYDRSTVQRLRLEQDRYFETSTVLTREAWENRSILTKTCENLARLAAPLL